MASELPDVATVLASVLQRVAREDQPLLIALAERLAAERYRAWASEVSSSTQRDELMACAEREEKIAALVEGLYPNGPATQQRLLDENPDLLDVNKTLFAGRPLPQQFTIQANGERLGAATWRALAAVHPPAQQQILLSCAELEEQSAAVLEAILAA